MPMMRGSTPTTAVPTIRASGLRSYLDKAASDAMIKAAAPSLTPEEFPAVTEPFLRKGVARFASLSSGVSRGCSSVSNTTGLHFCVVAD